MPDDPVLKAVCKDAKLWAWPDEAPPKGQITEGDEKPDVDKAMGLQRIVAQIDPREWELQ